MGSGLTEWLCCLWFLASELAFLGIVAYENRVDPATALILIFAWFGCSMGFTGSIRHVDSETSESLAPVVRSIRGHPILFWCFLGASLIPWLLLVDYLEAAATLSRGGVLASGGLGWLVIGVPTSSATVTAWSRIRRTGVWESYPAIVSQAPGWQLLRLSSWVFSPKIVTSILEPTIRDMQDEHMAALAEGRPNKAR